MDSHANYSIASLRLRPAAIGVESDTPYTDSSDKVGDSDDNQDRLRVRFADDVILMESPASRPDIEE